MGGEGIFVVKKCTRGRINQIPGEKGVQTSALVQLKILQRDDDTSGSSSSDEGVPAKLRYPDPFIDEALEAMFVTICRPCEGLKADGTDASACGMNSNECVQEPTLEGMHNNTQ